MLESERCQSILCRLALHPHPQCIYQPYETSHGRSWPANVSRYNNSLFNYSQLLTILRSCLSCINYVSYNPLIKLKLFKLHKRTINYLQLQHCTSRKTNYQNSHIPKLRKDNMAVSSRYLLLWDDLAQPHLSSTLFSFVFLPHNN